MTDRSDLAAALLAEVESQLDRVDSSLLAGDPAALQDACGELRRAAAAVAQLAAASAVGRPEPALRRRIGVVAQRLGAQRTNLARRSVVVERALDSIMGAQAGVTYSLPAARAVFDAPGSH